MKHLLNQPSIKTIECVEPNLTKVQLPALIRFECLVKLPKTNPFYKKLHEITEMKFYSKFIEASGGEGFSRASMRFLNKEEVIEVERQISEAVSDISFLRKSSLLFFPGTLASPRIEVEMLEPFIELDKTSPMKFKSLYRLVSKEYLVKEHLGKEDYHEAFLFASGNRLQDFKKGKKVKFEKVRLVPLWVSIREIKDENAVD